MIQDYKKFAKWLFENAEKEYTPPMPIVDTTVADVADVVVAVGSIVRRPGPDQGGIALTDPQAAADIRERWRANLRKAAGETNPKERKRLMTVAVAGAGICGIETSAELALEMQKEASSLRMNPSDISVYLLNGQERLFMEGSEKVGRKLDQILSECGVTVLYNRKVMRRKQER
ncbi:MAG: FAD-dependent pyridine nucleotide-disulfide oxidoreductase [Paenibacillus sp.]|jgi:NADH dehydrogenase|nr:FAD-dependent pyridine nucleotide-disulfide oxidoreductase [Paenibacillus sp.]